MKVVSVTDEMLGTADHTLLVREDNPFEDIKVLVTKGIDGAKRYSVRCELEAEDLTNIMEHAGSVWLTFFAKDIPEFMIFTAEV